MGPDPLTSTLTPKKVGAKGVEGRQAHTTGLPMEMRLRKTHARADNDGEEVDGHLERRGNSSRKKPSTAPRPTGSANASTGRFAWFCTSLLNHAPTYAPATSKQQIQQSGWPEFLGLNFLGQIPRPEFLGSNSLA